MKPTKKTILFLVLLLWVVFSVGYIANDMWSNYKNIQLAQAYNQGGADVINALIQEAEKCEQVSVFSGEKEIRLMNLGCPAN